MFLFNILESEDSYEDLETIISKIRKHYQKLSPLFRLSFLIHYLSTSIYYIAVFVKVPITLSQFLFISKVNSENKP